MPHRCALSSRSRTSLVLCLTIPLLAACAHNAAPVLPAVDAQGRFLRDTLIIASPSHGLYAGTTTQVTGEIWRRGATQPDTTARIHWSVQQVDNGWVAENGTLVLLDRGTIMLIAEAGVLQTSVELEIDDNPVEDVMLGPDTLVNLAIGDTARFDASLTKRKDSGNVRVHYAIATRGLGPIAGASIDQDGRFVARRPGIYTVLAVSGNAAARATVMVADAPRRGWSEPLDELEIEEPDYQPYVGTFGVMHAIGRPALRSENVQLEEVYWRSSDTSIARVASNGTVAFVGDGRVTITASAGGREAARSLHVRRDAAAHMALRLADHDIRVGDEVRLNERIWQKGGMPIRDARVNYAVVSHSGPWMPDAVEILEDGRFVARRPGVYTIIAELGGLADQATFVVRKAESVARVGAAGR